MNTPPSAGLSTTLHPVGAAALLAGMHCRSMMHRATRDLSQPKAPTMQPPAAPQEQDQVAPSLSSMANDLLQEIFGDQDQQATNDSAWLQYLLHQCKNLALRRTTHICASVLRCLIHCIIAKVPLSLPCLSPVTIHTIDEEGANQEKRESPFIWITRGALKSLLWEVGDYEREQNLESYNKKFGKIAVYILSHEAAHNQGSWYPYTTELQSYFGRSTSFCAQELNRMEGETPENILTLLDQAIADDNLLSEYCQVHLASYGNELHGSIELKNPFLPEEIVRIRRQGQTYYGI